MGALPKKSSRLAAIGALGLGAACTTQAVEADRDAARSLFEYRGVQTRLLDDEIVNFQVEMRGASSSQDVSDYAECAAAQYTLIRGYGFARHVRTNVQEESGLWRADAVYTVSPALPRGLQTIDAEVVVADCAELGIPTV